MTLKRRISIPLSSTLVTTAACVLFAAGCGKSDSKDNGDGGSPGPNGPARAFSRNALNQVSLTRTFDAVTPKGMKPSAASALLLDSQDDVEAQCVAISGDASKQVPEYKLCLVAFAIRSSFFQSGPAVIRDRLMSFDGTLNGNLQRISDFYVPCLNPQHTSAKDYDVAVGPGTPQKTTVPAYSLVNMPVKTTFGDGSVLDTGMSLNLSCMNVSETDTPSGKMVFKTGFGFKDGTWSLVEDIARGMNLSGTVDADENMNIWFSLGDRKATKNGPSAEPAGATKNPYPQSSSVMNIIARPKQNLLGISVGGGDNGCGVRVLMNDTALYFKGNVNNYGKCFPGDFGEALAGPEHTPEWNDVSLCMKVSGNVPEPAALGEGHCIQAGLLETDDDGNVVDPFENAGLKNLVADADLATDGALYARAWAGPHFMATADYAKVPKLLLVPLSPNDTVQVKGFTAISWALTKPSNKVASNFSKTAACSAGTASKTGTLVETYELKVADLLADMLKNAKKNSNSSPNQAAPTADSLLAGLNSSLALTGETAPKIEIPVTRTLGTNYRGTFKLSAKVKLDGKEKATVALASPSKATETKTVGVAKPGALTLTKTSTLVVDVTGSFALQCDGTASSFDRTAAVKVAVPRLVWFVDESKKNKDPEATN
ncbi:MAG: hypothetical protein IOD12_12665 [Silvanigrellales bacterium]|nr:hypothetical protein [Silvanigrellales bacterium]